MPIKYETPTIRAPSRRLNLPCFDLSCRLKDCKKRSYIEGERLKEEIRLGTYSCKVLKCKNRLGVEKTVKITFCESEYCKNLDLKKLQCRLRPTRSGRLRFGNPHGVLRMHRGSDKGWHYRELA